MALARSFKAKVMWNSSKVANMAQQELDGNGAGLEHSQGIGEAARLAQAVPKITRIRGLIKI